MNISDVLSGMEVVYGPLQEHDRVESAELDRVESRFGVALPAAVRVWYESAGLHPSQFVRSRLCSLEELVMSPNGLVFYRDPDADVRWFVDAQELSLDNPPVMELIGSVVGPTVFCSVSVFLAFQCAWQAIDGGLPFVGVVLALPTDGEAVTSPRADVGTLQIASLGMEFVAGEQGLVRCCDGGALFAGADGYLGMAACDEIVFRRMSAVIGMSEELWDYSTYEEL